MIRSTRLPLPSAAQQGSLSCHGAECDHCGETLSSADEPTAGLGPVDADQLGEEADSRDNDARSLLCEGCLVDAWAEVPRCPNCHVAPGARVCEGCRANAQGAEPRFKVRYFDAKASSRGAGGVREREFVFQADAAAFAREHRIYARPCAVEPIARAS